MLLTLTVGAVTGGWIPDGTFSSSPVDHIFVTLKMPEGTSFEKTNAATIQIQDGLDRLRFTAKS